MPNSNRRRFLSHLLLGTASALASRTARAADARIEVLPDEAIGPISPDIYGHFTEHIGGVVYDGIWVGENSKIPNQGGLRSALIEHLRRLKPPVIRWPGGCFADSYDWRDGIGPRSRRPKRTNFWVDELNAQKAPDGPQKYDPNEFGTDEFIRFCRLTGAQPYLAANIRSLSPKDFYQWVEYCNAPAGLTSLSAERAANGSREPFGVRFWGVGNESWGCGGLFNPEDYAVEFRKFIAWVPRYGMDPAFIGSGPSGDDLNWTRGFFHKLTETDRNLVNSLYGWALHYYCGTSGKGNPVDFTVEDWYELLGKADRMDSLITQHWAAMSEVDTQHHVKLVVDEWGAWHRPGTEIDPAFLFGQMPTLRDALISALTLDTFNRHADKVTMANVAQLINNLHCLFLAHEEKFLLTPTYHVFDMYGAHRGGKSIRTVFSSPAVAYREASSTKTLWGLAGSASLQGHRLVLTVVNPHHASAREAEIAVRGASIKGGEATTLSATELNAHNTFTRPDALVPRAAPLAGSGPTVIYRFPPASVTRLTLDLG